MNMTACATSMDTLQPFQAIVILLYAYIGGLWVSIANWNDDALISSLKKLPAALISSFKLMQKFFDLTNYLVNE
jgi:hypothetical protein